MKFRVSRVSDGQVKPCEEAKAEELTTYVPMQDEAKGYIRKENGWTVEIDDLNSLIQFKERYGEIVILDSCREECPHEIEIYDDYRE